ncbi:MAG: sigma-70 family RNA polymerase sigma factor [Planctomycetaceae bacterium]|nr:sigma-70 family RNA polymerase sigma factor [Planctomycetaceae bacterium]
MDATPHGEYIADRIEVHRDRLRRCVRFWMPDGLRGKLSDEDIIQDTAVQALRRAGRLQSLGVSHFVWLRGIARDILNMRIREFYGTQQRDVSRERSLAHGSFDDNSSLRLVDALLADTRSPSSVVRTKESCDALRVAIEELSEQDREIILMTFYEGLRTSEVAEIMQITDAAVTTRRTRALGHLRNRLNRIEQSIGP